MSEAPAGVGHNSAGETTVINPAAKDQLKSVVARINNLLNEKQELMEGIKEVYAEAKGNGFDVKVLRKVVARSRLDQAKLAEEDAILDLYLSVVLGT